MTKQIVDAIYYNDERHLPISMSGKGLPHPKTFGLRPFAISSGCWRGFYCEYTIRENRLWLTHLVVGHDGDYPQIDGISAMYEEDRILKDGESEPEFIYGRSVFRSLVGKGIGERELHYDGGIYANLNVPAPLTGGILLGIGEVDARYIEFYFNYLSHSETILELMFENGVLIKTIDHSASVSAKRNELVEKQRPKLNSAEYDVFEADIRAWIRSTLTLEYQFFDIKWLNEVYG